MSNDTQKSALSSATPDRAEADRHIELLTGSADSVVTFQTFDDRADRKSPTLIKVMHGTLEECWPDLCTLSATGAGVFITVNETNGKGRRTPDIIRVRALFIDGDDLDLPTFLVEPSFVTSRGPRNWHAYWVIDDGDLATFAEDQKQLIAHYGSDAKIHDLPRVMRLCGFPHQKDPANTAIYKVMARGGK